VFTVQCYFEQQWENALATVKAGYIYTIRGKCEGKPLNVSLKECRFPQ
jgi:hypothetical protein